MLGDDQRFARIQGAQHVIGTDNRGELFRQVAERGGMDLRNLAHLPVQTDAVERRGRVLRCYSDPSFTSEQIAATKRLAAATPPAEIDPKIDALVTELIGRVAEAS
ncbi:hypothetical protein [Sphingomonas sp.]|uniref:hypothetical protein n=1 Tax=Sphingomonas sp. TaxID=28214 RepID=UPI003B006B59